MIAIAIALVEAASCAVVVYQVIARVNRMSRCTRLSVFFPLAVLGASAAALLWQAVSVQPVADPYLATAMLAMAMLLTTDRRHK